MKGILFKPWKIKAIAEGSPDFEWQTRRLHNLKEINAIPNKWGNDWSFNCVGGLWYASEKHGYQCAVKPRYQVDEVVYIKEAWRPIEGLEGGGIPRLGIKFGKAIEWKLDNPNQKGKWRSPLFMPAWSARYFIKITGVRAERLQEITPKDCIAEGLKLEPDFVLVHTAMLITGTNNLGELNNELIRMQYAELWDSINPKYPWSDNGWGWVYTFKKVDKPV